MVRAVLFDLFETLITESETRPPGAASLGPRLGLDPVAFREEWRGRRPAITLGKLSFVDALAEIGVALGSPVDPSRLEAIRRQRLLVKAGPLERVEAGVLGLLDELLRRGKRIAVVSNCFAEDVEAWSVSPLSARTHCTVFSFEVGLAKPDPAIYREAVHRLGVRPEAALFIGDGGDGELAGATLAGLRAYRALWFLARWGVTGGDGEETDGALRTPEDAARLVA